MNIFQQYGIKEVADVCLYAIELDENDDEIYIPVLYLDTLKVSTVEQSAEQTSAQGGVGNPKLITWDYGKEITVVLEDALFTPASQGIMWGNSKEKNFKLYLRNFFDRETDEKNPNLNLRGATLNIEHFSDFILIPDRWPTYELKNKQKMITTGSVGGTSIYCWLINGNIISNDRKKRVKINDLILFYREQTQKWYFFNGKGPTNSEKTWYIYNRANNDIKNYGIGYQYGKDTFNWIKENLSGNNNQKWIKYEKGEWEEELGIKTYNKEEEDQCRWTEYEPVALETYSEWIVEDEKGNINFDCNIMSGDALFLTQNLYIDGYIYNPCGKNRKYSELTQEEIAEIEEGLYVPYKYTASIDIEYNTNIIPPQEATYKIDYGQNDVFYIDRIEKCKASRQFCIDTDINLKHAQYRFIKKYDETELTVYLNPKTMQAYQPNSYEYYRLNGQRITGNLRVFQKNEVYYKWTRTKARRNTTLGKQIIIDANHFPGTYRLVGETFIRDRYTGEDQRYQFEIPLCKMQSNNNLTLQADGEPAVFTMNLTALRKNDGTMMKLTSYDIIGQKYEEYDSGSSVIKENEIKMKQTLSELNEANEKYIEDQKREELSSYYSNLNIQTPTDQFVYDINTNPTTSLTKESGMSADISQDTFDGKIHVSVDYNIQEKIIERFIRKDTINTDEEIFIAPSQKIQTISETRYLNNDEYEITLTEQEE